MAELAVRGCPVSDALFRAGAVYCCQEVGRIKVDPKLVMVLHFLVTWLLLQGTNRLTGGEEALLRSAAAASFGSLYGGVWLLSGGGFLSGGFWQLAGLVLVCLMAFGLRRGTVKRTGLFLLLSMALSGIALSLGRNNWTTLFLSVTGVWLLSRAVFDEGGKFIPLELFYGENCLRLKALRDTGNTLRDPISGEQVLVLSPEAAVKLTGLTQAQLKTPMETLISQPIPGLRLIPYRTVGTAGGFLLGLRLESARLGGKRQSVIAAFAPEGLGKETGVQALTGGMV